jgi:hypothetical protein
LATLEFPCGRKAMKALYTQPLKRDSLCRI